jgi:hypothetical protein
MVRNESCAAESIQALPCTPLERFFDATLRAAPERSTAKDNRLICAGRRRER